MGSKNQFRNGSDSIDHRNCLDVYDRFLCIKGFFGTCRTVDRHHGHSDNEYTFDVHDFIWLVILVLIFGGLGFIGRILLADRKNEEVDPREEMYREMYGEQTDKKSKRRKK